MYDGYFLVYYYVNNQNNIHLFKISLHSLGINNFTLVEKLDTTFHWTIFNNGTLFLVFYRVL